MHYFARFFNPRKTKFVKARVGFQELLINSWRSLLLLDINIVKQKNVTAFNKIV